MLTMSVLTPVSIHKPTPPTEQFKLPSTTTIRVLHGCVKVVGLPHTAVTCGVIRVNLFYCQEHNV